MEIWDNVSGLGNGTIRSRWCKAFLHILWLLLCSSFIFVSLKTFHEELKTSSFVSLSPAPLPSAPIMLQQKCLWRWRSTFWDCRLFSRGHCTAQSLLVPPAYLILISRQSFKPPTVQISLGETNYSAATHSPAWPPWPTVTRDKWYNPWLLTGFVWLYCIHTETSEKSQRNISLR